MPQQDFWKASENFSQWPVQALVMPGLHLPVHTHTHARTHAHTRFSSSSHPTPVWFPDWPGNLEVEKNISGPQVENLILHLPRKIICFTLSYFRHTVP